MTSAQVNVSTATQLIGVEQSDRVATVRNTGTVSVYLGGSNAVTTSTGLELPATASVGVELTQGDALWAIAASGTVRVDVLRAGG